MYTVKPSSRFKKDLKLVKRRGYDMKLITEVIKKLASGEPLPDSNFDHSLTDDYVGLRECHITPDWLLIYKLSESTLILYLTRTGTHADLF